MGGRPLACLGTWLALCECTAGRVGSKGPGTGGRGGQPAEARDEGVAQSSHTRGRWLWEGGLGLVEEPALGPLRSDPEF